MSIALVIIIILLSSLTILLAPIFKTSTIDRKFWLGAWFIKIAMMFVLFMLYSHQYTDRSKADIFRYYDDAQVLKEIAGKNPKVFSQLMIGSIDKDPLFLEYLRNTTNIDLATQSPVMGNNDLIVKTHVLFSLIPFSSYHSNALLFNLLGFLGLMFIFSFIKNFIPEKKWLLFLIIILLPSLLLWTSGPLKESLLLFGIGSLLRSGQMLLTRKSKIYTYSFFLLGCFILWNTRAFYAITIVPIFLIFLINSIKQPKKVGLNYFVLLFIFITLLWEGGNIHSSLDFKQMMIDKNQQFVELAHKEEAGSILSQPHLENSLLGFAKALPHAIVNTVFRPLPWKLKGPMYILMLLENIMLYAFIIWILFNSKFKLKNKNLFNFLFITGIAILLINGMIVPILGALARYRSLGILFILLALLNLDFKQPNLKLFKNT